MQVAAPGEPVSHGWADYTVSDDVDAHDDECRCHACDPDGYGVDADGAPNVDDDGCACCEVCGSPDGAELVGRLVVCPEHVPD